MENVVLLNEADNVGNAIEDIKAGCEAAYLLAGKPCAVAAAEDIRFGFKIALKKIPKDDDIIKYGEIIGLADRDISPGELVHVHNIKGRRGRGDLVK